MRIDFDKYVTGSTSTYSAIKIAVFPTSNKKQGTMKPGRLQIDLLIKMVYMPGTQEQFLRSLDTFKENIGAGN